MKKFLFTLGFIISFIAISAQNHITGTIIESSNNTGISYVTIQAINLEKKYTSVATSDILGNFILSVKIKGKYKLKFDAMGYGGDSLIVDIIGPNTNIGQIKLVEGQQLNGVTVVARKLIMKDEGDRLVYNVLNDPEAKKLKMSDIMKKIPFITIDAIDGKLKYLDNKVAKITIDGKYNELINSGRQFHETYQRRCNEPNRDYIAKNKR